MKRKEMKKLTAVFFLLLSLSVYAQEQDSRAPIKARPYPCSYASLVPLNKPPAKVRKNKPKPKPPVLLTLDIPLNSRRLAVDSERLGRGDVGIGSARGSWEENLRYNLAIAPELNYLSGNVQASIGGGWLKSSRENRATRFFYGSAEGSIWKAVLGVDGFADDEKARDVFSGVEFTADFARLSYGGRGWAGIKFGNYSESFFAVKSGAGFIRTQGSRIYNAGNVEDLEPLPLYGEDFLVRSVTAESRLSAGRFVGRFKAEKNFYRRLLNSPNPQMYGNNEFNELVAKAALEFILWPKHDVIRLAAVGQENFGSRDSLMFRDYPPILQVFLKIRLK